MNPLGSCRARRPLVALSFEDPQLLFEVGAHEPPTISAVLARQGGEFPLPGGISPVRRSMIPPPPPGSTAIADYTESWLADRDARQAKAWT